MKRKTMLLLGLCFSFVLMAQTVLKFEKEEHDFGKISENGGAVAYDFEFTNVTDSAIVITNVVASCGCTAPSWPKKMIEPGEKEKITVSYNPKGRPGFFKKRVTITLQNSNSQLLLFIKGDVVKTNEAPKNGDVDLRKKGLK